MARHPAAWLVALGAVALGIAACARPPVYGTFTSPSQKFSIAYPQGWEIVKQGEDARVWFLPPGSTADRDAPHLSTPEFLLVFTETSPGPLTDDQARQVGLNLLPIHGVSGFRRIKEEKGVIWHRFEVTGISGGGREWASVGLLVTGPKAFHYVVCAKPLDKWRDGQKQCDEILRTFKPGPLS